MVRGAKTLDAILGGEIFVNVVPATGETTITDGE